MLGDIGDDLSNNVIPDLIQDPAISRPIAEEKLDPGSSPG